MAGRVRRRVFLGATAAAAGAGVAAIAAGVDHHRSPGTATAAGSPGLVPFRGPRQAGVVTPPPPFAAWRGLDLPRGADRDLCRRLLTVVTDDAERLMAATPTLTDQARELAAVPADLTITLAVGPAFYDALGRPEARPSWLRPLPPFAIDALQPAWGQTDVLLQVCAASPVVVAHAVRQLTVDLATLAIPRWVQYGFREPLTETMPGLPFRNPLGQIDGTSQPRVDGPDDDLLWIGPEGPAGLTGGTSLVLRRIAIDLDGWDRVDRVGRENAVGRRLGDGAPVTGGGTAAEPDLQAEDAFGFHVVDDAAHVRRASPSNPRERILRRPYTYQDTPAGGSTTATGLVFASFQADPVEQYLPIQRRLAEADLLNRWTTPVGSGVYAVLPGAEDGTLLGDALTA